MQTLRFSCPCVGHHTTSGAPLESPAQPRPPLFFLSFACASGLAENDVASRPSLVMPRSGHDRLAVDAGGEMQLMPPADAGRLLVPHAHLQGRFLIQRCGVQGHRHGQGLAVPARRLSEWAIGTGNPREHGAGGNERCPHWPISGELPLHVGLLAEDAPDPTCTSEPGPGARPRHLQHHTMKGVTRRPLYSCIDLGYGRFIKANVGITASTWARETLFAAKHSLCDVYQRGAQNFVVKGALVAGFAVWRSPMTAIIQAVSRLTRTDVDAEPLKTVLVFSGSACSCRCSQSKHTA